jgi:O-Antigen ligase
VAGGTSLPSRNLFLVLSIVNFCLLGLAVWHMRFVPLPHTSKPTLMIISATLITMGLQLVPLPPQVWTGLPGRQPIMELDGMLPQSQNWMPLSLTSATTLQDILALLPGIAAFVAAFAAPLHRHKDFAVLIGAFSMLNIFAVQGSGGLFANQNFSAAAIYCGLGFGIYLAQDFFKMPLKFWVVIGIVAVASLASIGATGSRFSLLLGILLVVFSTFGLRSPYAGIWKKMALAAIVIFIAFFVFESRAAQRLDGLNIALNFRADVFSNSLAAAIWFFPAGSGFGSFVPVYQMFETPDTLQAAFINHAHNDWIELIIEGGLPMVLILGCGLWWFATTSARIFKNTAAPDYSHAAIFTSGALMVHSLVDYPLRNAALMSVFGMCIGLVARAATHD